MSDKKEHRVYGALPKETSVMVGTVEMLLREPSLTAQRRVLALITEKSGEITARLAQLAPADEGEDARAQRVGKAWFELLTSHLDEMVAILLDVEENRRTLAEVAPSAKLAEWVGENLAAASQGPDFIEALSTVFNFGDFVSRMGAQLQGFVGKLAPAASKTKPQA